MTDNDPKDLTLRSGSGGYHPKSPSPVDEWIVQKNWQDDATTPLWIGSKYRSVTEPIPTPLRRIFQHDDRFAEFRLAWQDPDYPEHIHLIGAFQADRGCGTFDSEPDEEEEMVLFSDIQFRCHARSIQARMGKDPWTEIGRSDQSFRGCSRQLANGFLIAPHLGKTRGEILVHFLRADEKYKRTRLDLKRIHGIDPQPRPPCAEVRDFILRHAWDNTRNIPHPYSDLKGRLGMYDLPR